MHPLNPLYKAERDLGYRLTVTELIDCANKFSYLDDFVHAAFEAIDEQLHIQDTRVMEEALTAFFVWWHLGDV